MRFQILIEQNLNLHVDVWLKNCPEQLHGLCGVCHQGGLAPPHGCLEQIGITVPHSYQVPAYLA